MSDLRYALRTLRKDRAFTAMVALTLGLGIGATTAMFSVVNAVLIRSLPFPQSHELVQVYSTWEDGPSTVSPPDFTDWRADNRVFSELAAINSRSNALTGEGPAEQIPAAAVTEGFFSVLGVSPETGRVLVAGDDVAGAEPVVVLGHSLWQRRFGGVPDVLGRRVALDGELHTVVGVMPPGFNFPNRAELWTPLTFTENELATQRGAHYLDVIGRLRAGVMLEQAETDIRLIAARLSAAYPATNAESGVVLESLTQAIVGDVRPALRILLASVGLVLLIACVNVANLMLVRAGARGRELAVRRAVGASPWRLARGLLVESVALAVVGGSVGMSIAFWGTRLIVALESSGVPRLEETRIDLTVLGLALLVTLATAMLFGVVPAWRAARTGEPGLREGFGSAGAELGRRGSPHLLVVAQLALALVLLAGAGLLLRSLFQLARVDLGIVPDRVLTFAVNLPDATYRDPDRRALFIERLTERLQALPGVESAGLVFGLPLSGFGYVISAYELDGRRLEREESDRLSVQVRAVTPDYFRTLGIVVRRGRGIGPTDRHGALQVMVVNETAARLLWPDADPIGRRLSIGTGFGLGRGQAGGEVVGVVSDVREQSPASGPRPTVFLPLDQWPQSFLGVAVKTAGDPAALVSAAGAAVTALDADVPVFRVRTLEQLAADAVAQPRLYAGLLGLFAVMATLLAGIGVYGVVARAMHQRRREVGIRMALGARPAQVRRVFMWRQLPRLLVGVAIGAGGGLALTRMLQGLLFEVSASDPVAFGAAAAMLICVAGAAAYWPVWRATRGDPMEVLRCE